MSMSTDPYARVPGGARWRWSAPVRAVDGPPLCTVEDCQGTVLHSGGCAPSTGVPPHHRQGWIGKIHHGGAPERCSRPFHIGQCTVERGTRPTRCERSCPVCARPSPVSASPHGPPTLNPRKRPSQPRGRTHPRFACPTMGPAAKTRHGATGCLGSVPAKGCPGSALAKGAPGRVPEECLAVGARKATLARVTDPHSRRKRYAFRKRRVPR